MKRGVMRESEDINMGRELWEPILLWECGNWSRIVRYQNVQQKYHNEVILGNWRKSAISMGIVGTDSDLGVGAGLKFYNENVRYQNVKQVEVYCLVTRL